MTGTSLKARNVTWQWAVVGVDAIACVIVAAPGLLAELNWLTMMKSSILAAAPVCVLLLTSLLSSEQKASLVFFRWRHAYPGHRAFSDIGPRDSRFRMEDLRANVGEFPHEPADQNALWFRLYKKVESDTTVSESHRNFLLFRDLAAMSLLMIPVAIVASLLAGISVSQMIAIGAIFLTQFIVTALAAKHSGTRMVMNVLALHAIKRRR